MPRTKSLQHYPDRYQEIIRECGLEGKQVTLNCESRLQALKLRGHWYAFVGSLKAHVAGLRQEAARRVLTTGEKELETLCNLAPTVMVQVTEGPNYIQLAYQSREHSWQAKLLATATVTQAEAAPTVPAKLDETAARLMGIQQSVDLKEGKDGEPGQ